MNVDAVVKRAYLSLEDGDFSKAYELLDQALNEEPENAAVYVGLLCAELKVHSESELANCNAPIADYNNFKKAVRFGDESLVARLNDYNTAIMDKLAAANKKRGYSSVMPLLAIISNNPEATPEQCVQKATALSDIAKRLRAVGDYEDALAVADKCERDAAELIVLSERRREEVATDKKAKEKRSRRKLTALLIAAVIVAVIAGGLIAFPKVCSIINEKYSLAAEEAYNNGDYEKAKALYVKSLWFYTHEKNAPDASNIPYWTETYSKKCDRTKLAVEAFEYINNGDYEKGNSIFDNNQVSLLDLPQKILKEKLPTLLNKLNPVEVVTNSLALYWVNRDGTVGRIGGNSVVDNWKDIAKIKVNDIMSYSVDYVHDAAAYVAGLKSDGTLINNAFDSYSVNDVTDFGIATFQDHLGQEYPIVAAVKSDGTIAWYSGNDKPNIQCGMDIVSTWSNVKAIKFVNGQYANITVVDPDSQYRSEYANIDTNRIINVFNLVAETNEGEILSSAYNIKLIYPSADKTAQDIANSISGGSGWNDVFNYLQGSGQLPNSSSSSGNHAAIELVPIFEFKSMPPTDTILYLNQCSLSKDSNGQWSVSGN